MWDVSPETAADRIRGQPATTSSRPGPDWRHYAKFWDKARAYYPTSRATALHVARRRHAFELDASPERWAVGPGLLVGAADAKEAQDVFYPNTAEGRPAFLTGRNWDEVVVASWYDLPGSICAFSFIGRNADPVDDVAWRRTSLRRTEAGLLGLPSVHAAPDNGTVLAIDDWLLSLHVQFRVFRESLHPAPLVVWRDDGVCRTATAWRSLGNKRVVFWAMTGPEHSPGRDSVGITPTLIRQASEIDGWISMAGSVGTTRPEIYKWLRYNPGNQVVDMVARTAMPWHEALRRWAAVSRPGEVQDLIAGLERIKADTSMILRYLGGVAPLTKPVRQVTYGSKTLIERQDRWLLQKRDGEKEISSAVLKLTHVITDKSTGDIFYRGEVRSNNKRMLFLAPEAEVRLQPAKFVAEIMLKDGLGVFRVDRQFAKHLHDIAVTFDEPEALDDDLWRWTEKLTAEKALEP